MTLVLAQTRKGADVCASESAELDLTGKLAQRS
jgi:hypothetical protein